MSTVVYTKVAIVQPSQTLWLPCNFQVSHDFDLTTHIVEFVQISSAVLHCQLLCLYYIARVLCVTAGQAILQHVCISAFPLAIYLGDVVRPNFHMQVIRILAIFLWISRSVHPRASQTLKSTVRQTCGPRSSWILQHSVIREQVHTTSLGN